MVAWPYPGDVVVLMCTVMVQPVGWCRSCFWPFFGLLWWYCLYKLNKTVQIKSLFKYNTCHLFLLNFITNLGYQLIYYITWRETKTWKLKQNLTKIYSYQNLKKLIKLIFRSRLCGLRVVSRVVSQKKRGLTKPSRTRWKGALVWNEISCRLLSATRARLLPPDL